MHELLIVLRQHLDMAREHHYDLLGLFSVRHDKLVRRVDASIELYDELVAEADLARIKEVLEPLDELVEDGLDQLGLHLRGELVVQAVLLHDQVMIIVERILNRELYIAVQVILKMVRLIAELYLFHPDQQTVHALRQQVFKADFGGENG